MPNLITHALHAQKVFDRKGMVMDKNSFDAYIIGSSGPDFLFFYFTKRSLKNRDFTINKAGSRLHITNINKQYEAMVKAYHNLDDPNEKLIAKNYIKGHTLHWRLDSMFHPYVVYESGWNSTNHHYIESYLDMLFLDCYYNSSIKDFSTYEICESSEVVKKVIGKIYQVVLKEALDLTVSQDDIIQSLNSWHTIQKFLYSPNGKKRRLLEKIEPKKGLVTSLMVPYYNDSNIDYLNLSHQTYANPVSGEQFRYSMIELMDLAVEKGDHLLELVDQALDDNTQEPLLNYIDNITYANGVNGEQKRHYKGELIKNGVYR